MFGPTADQAATFLQQGIQNAKMATQADQAGRVSDALKYYEATLSLLQQAINFDTQPQRKVVTQQKMQEYAERKSHLQRKLAGGASPGPSLASAATGAFQQQPTLRKVAGQPVFNAKGLEYRVGKKLGGGNFGVVHDCQDVFGRDYVIKVLKTNRPEAEVREDWAKETSFLFSLSHPNIIQLYDAFPYNGLYHMVMERASGSIRDYVKNHGAMPGPSVLNVASQCLSGLHHIHMRDIIHRDLHIDNVLYKPSDVPGEVAIKITDFGISKLLKSDQKAAVTFIGRDYDYAPELVTKGHTTQRSDIYQCGLVLFHLYTGRHALSAADGSNVVQIITSGIARQRAQELNTKLGDVIGIMLRREPDYRFKDCVECWLSLSAILS